MTQELKERIMHFDNNSDPFMRYNHVQLTNIDDGFAQVEVPLSEIHLNCWGSPHGGILFSITDIAGGVAVMTLRQEVCVTVSTTIEYLAAPAPTGTLIATGRVRRMGRRLCFCDTEVQDETGRLIAKTSVIYSFTGKSFDL